MEYDEDVLREALHEQQEIDADNDAYDLDAAYLDDYILDDVDMYASQYE